MPNDVIEERRKLLWLSWLDLPWDTVRESLAVQMRERGMSHEALAYALGRAGHRVSHVTVGQWIGGHVKKAPSLDAMKALVAVFADDSSSDRETRDSSPGDMTPPEPPYIVSLEAGDFDRTLHGEEFPTDEPESQAFLSRAS